MFFGGFEFAAVLSQFRRHEIESKRAVQIRFVANRWNLPRQLLFFGLRIRRQLRQPVFVQRPAALEGATAHLDVVFLAPGKIIERKRIFRRTDHTQIALNS